jgi:hypothetical protein
MKGKELQTIDKSVELDKTGKETLLALLTHRTKTAAAKSLSISQQALYQRIDKYELNKFIAELPARALQQLQLGSIRAAEVMVEQLDDRQNKMEASKEILDRTGVVRKQPQTQVNIAGKEMSVEFIGE